MFKKLPFNQQNPTPPVNNLQEELVMVKLKPNDLELIIEMLQLVCDYKAQALRPQRWQTFQQDYLPSIIDQIKNNEFKCHRHDDNTLLWLLDQVCHSRQLHPGVPHNQGMGLIDTPLGERVSEICRAASQGQRYYDSWSNSHNFNRLFS